LILFLLVKGLEMKASTKITRNEEGEYRVRLFIEGEYQPGSDYFTDCKIDAKETAKEMERNAFLSDLSTYIAKEEMEDYKEEMEDC